MAAMCILCFDEKLCNSKCLLEIMCKFSWRVFNEWVTVGFGLQEIVGREAQTQFLVYWDREGRFVHVW